MLGVLLSIDDDGGGGDDDDDGRVIPLYSWRALWAPGVEAPGISRQSIHEGGKANAAYRPPLPLGDISGSHFC